MNRWKKIGSALLFPHPILAAVLAAAAAGLLIWSFAVGWPYESLTIGSYVLSAYALTLVCVRAPEIWRFFTRFRRENPLVQRYLSDQALQLKLSLYFSVSINLLYALLQLGLGFYHHSIWFYALSGYYGLLAAMRLVLLRDARRLSEGERRLPGFRRYRLCGLILLPITLALSVIVMFIVRQNRGFVHGEILTIALAAHTFLSMTLAVMNVLKQRSHENPWLLTAKTLNLTAALVSLLSLETAMLTAFGQENAPLFRQIMTGTTGAAVCLLVLAMAVYMIVRGTKEIKKESRHEA